VTLAVSQRPDSGHQKIMPQPVEVDEVECDAPEQRRVWATGRQLDADPRDVLDHARPDLDQALRMVANSHLASGLV
jgi:hypothetical protein